MFYPQNHVLARDVGEHDITRLQAQVQSEIALLLKKGGGR